MTSLMFRMRFGARSRVATMARTYSNRYDLCSTCRVEGTSSSSKYPDGALVICCPDDTVRSHSPTHVLAQRFFSSTTSKANSSPTFSAKVLTDFFGEPVTFLTGKDDANAGRILDSTPAVMAALDDFLVCIVSKGKSCSGGGDDFGLASQAAHSSAVRWAQVLKHTFELHRSCPTLSYVAVAPLLAQTGVAYVGLLDKLLIRTTGPTNEKSEILPLLDIARLAASQSNNPKLSPREQWHLRALDCLLRQNHQGALEILVKLLQHCPGDALALSIAMDISNIVGNKEAAIRAATTVSSYWHERGGRRQSIAGYSIGTSWIALGLAAGGRFAEAERLADQAIQQDSAGCGGIATSALAHAYDAEGRTSEGISLLVGFDGVQQYQTCGWLFFDSHLGGYGARFSLDREGSSGGKVALRLYDNCFERVLQYSGFARGEPWTKPRLRAPTTRSDRVVEKVEQSTKSIFQQLFGGETEIDKEKAQSTDSPTSDVRVVDKPVSVEDILAWLPPTPMMLTDATLLLLRLTINETVTPDDARWVNLRNAWSSMLDFYNNDLNEKMIESSLDYYPLAAVTSNLLSNRPPNEFDTARTDRASNVGSGLRLMGNLLGLSESKRESEEMRSELSDAKTKKHWAEVVKLLSGSAHDSLSLEEFEAWDADARPILEHAICYAACRSQDHDSLCVARAICSKGVSLRPNSPEEWWRYSVVLNHLSDEVAAEDARFTSVSLGSGEGSSL